MDYHGYITKFGFSKPELTYTQPSDTLELVVVIPAHNEPDISNCLYALINNEYPGCDCEVIIIVNAGEQHTDDIKKQNALTVAQAQEISEAKVPDWMRIHVIDRESLPRKHAGVGLARKIGMDEAVSRLHAVGNAAKGVICCFDADSTCASNYLKAIRNHFTKFPHTPGCAITYEHPVSGADFPSEIYEHIAEYELHLRYYRLALVESGFPYAFHTVGSSMAVRAEAYMKQGGMNKRKAGEDFYFLNKIMLLGNFTDLTTTRVYPSPRVSDRVPFGTGRAIGEMVASEQGFYSYHPDAFETLKYFFGKVEDYYRGDASVSEPMIGFLGESKWKEKLHEMISYVGSEDAFVKRFFAWFDGFMIMKFLHFYRDTIKPNIPVQQAAGLWLDRQGVPQQKTDVMTLNDYLLHFRERDLEAFDKIRKL